MLTVVARARPQSLLAVELVLVELLVDDELRAVVETWVTPLRALDSCDDNVDDEPELLATDTPAAGAVLAGNDNFAYTHTQSLSICLCLIQSLSVSVFMCVSLSPSLSLCVL